MKDSTEANQGKNTAAFTKIDIILIELGYSNNPIYWISHTHTSTDIHVGETLKQEPPQPARTASRLLGINSTRDGGLMFPHWVFWWWSVQNHRSGWDLRTMAYTIHIVIHMKSFSDPHISLNIISFVQALPPSLVGLKNLRQHPDVTCWATGQLVHAEHSQSIVFWLLATCIQPGYRRPAQV